MLPEAIEHYHSILSAADEKTIQEWNEKFLGELRARKASYGGRVLSHFLRPKFITQRQLEAIQVVCRAMREGILKVKEAFFEVPGFIDQVGLSEAERKLVDIDPGFPRLAVAARWDAVATETAIKLIDLKAEAPPGIAYSDIMSDIYLSLPFVTEFRKRYEVKSFGTRVLLLKALLETYRGFQGNKSGRKVPHVAIIDWQDVPTWPEFELFAEYFQSQGVPTVLADPRELDYSGGQLRKGDFHIDLIYRRLPANDLLEKSGEIQALLKAYEARDVCIVNSFRALLVSKQSLFAILTHEANQQLFSTREIQVIRKHIPWTRRIEDTETIYNGRRINLLEYISRNKDEFVIKPNDKFSGKSAVFGWETPQAQWEAEIQKALNDFYVVQERLEVPKESFPFYSDGLWFQELNVEVDPFIFGPEVGGALTRLSSSSFAQVTAGGGATATFVISER